nr:snake venom metalloproteinases P-III precursor [Malpolon monspessulanus]
MIRALLVIVCLAVFPYQGSSVIVESGNENDYEVEYPEEVAALAKGGFQDAQPETSEETMEFQLNGEPEVSNVAADRHCFRGHCWTVPKKNRSVGIDQLILDNLAFWQMLYPFLVTVGEIV